MSYVNNYIGAQYSELKANTGFIETPTNITQNYAITEGYNALTVGPVTIDPGVTVDIPTNSTWIIV